MSNFKKIFFSTFFTLCACLFATGGASAQTWSSDQTGYGNTCGVPGGYQSVGNAGSCQCPSGYSWGTANAGNCSYDGWIIGCWNPSSGKCQACGSGGTITLGQSACFNNGQSNAGVGPGPGCTVSQSTSLYESNGCISSGTSSGGFSTN